MRQTALRSAAAACLAIGVSTPAAARETGINGATLSPLFALPFVLLLAAIACVPLISARWWHRHDAKVIAGIALAVVLPFGAVSGASATASLVVHTLLIEYLPFVILLTTLFTVAGGIAVRGNPHGGPMTNVGLIAIGTGLASLIGTTGASMVMIRPLIRANDERRDAAHVVVFFIFLVSNIGGALTPLGDPPLFLGYLRGVDFTWTLRHIALETAIAVALPLGIFYLLDRRIYALDARLGARPDPTPDQRFAGIDGKRNILLLAMVIAVVLGSSVWKSGVALTVPGGAIALETIIGNLALIGIALLSLAITPPAARKANAFTFAPMREVATVFAGIFITLVPVTAMLAAGSRGPFAPLFALLLPEGGPANIPLFFWASGLLSSLLDNAPTYLVFFDLAGGDPGHLMGEASRTLAAISCGTVFMGAMTYIGNAPNLMVRAIAVENGIRMPGFFGYMAVSGAVLLPVFALITLVSFR